MSKIFGFMLITVLALSQQSVCAQDGSSSQAQPFELNASRTDMAPAQTYVPSYPKPMMVGQPAYAPPQPKQNSQPPKKLNSGIQRNSGQQASPVQNQAPMQSQQPVQGVLPPQFLGRWQVLGSRSNVEAMPQFQAGIDSIFSSTTSNTWNIQGSPQQGYVLSTDTGISTQLMVQTQGNTAILRYQHPIKNTVAQEALVMQLLPGGAQFDGLERISIVKQGEPGPRAKVTYKLIGHRQ